MRRLTGSPNPWIKLVGKPRPYCCTGVKSGAPANPALSVVADNPPKLKSPAKFNSKIADGILTNAMSPPNLNVWLPAITFTLSVNS